MASGGRLTAPIEGVRGAFIVSFLAVALYNFIELNFIIATTFKKRHGLYFWSFIVATWGVAIYSIGFILRDFLPRTSPYLFVTFIVVGWWPMVTGQSLVLYSRLHLVLYNRKVLRAVLAMIIANAIICNIPTIVLIYGANSANPEPFLTPYSIYEKFQVIMFFFQEMIISGLYISETTKILRIAEAAGHDRSRTRMMRHLIWVNILVGLFDIAILATELANFYSIQTAYKGFAYSVKLKLEFSILNRLVDFARSGSASSFARATDPSSTTDQSNTIDLEHLDDGGRPRQTLSNRSPRGNSRVGSQGDGAHPNVEETASVNPYAVLGMGSSGNACTSPWWSAVRG